ncbi:MAG: hypothetical protein AB7E81_08685 [Hyphomicrobiaceae bacterium]
MCNFDARRVEQFLSTLKAWAGNNQRVKGLALVGSWGADDRDRAEADADIVLIVDEPDHFRAQSAWMGDIDWGAAGLGGGRWSECDYGPICSRHFKFDDGPEIEVSIVGAQWAAVDPIHPVTRRVTGNGMRVVHDPDGLLGRLLTTL